MIRVLSLVVSLAIIGAAAEAQDPRTPETTHRVLMQGNGRLAIVDAGGELEWEMPWGGIHDIHVLDDGHILVQEGNHSICEIDPEKREVVWRYDCRKRNGNEGRRVEVHAFQPLGNGRLMIAESGPARIIEVDREGNLLAQVAMKVDNPHHHHDTRLARKLENGNYLVCHERDGAVREYDGDGTVVWEFRVPLFDRDPKGGHGLDAFGNAVFGALRLPSGNTLVATGNGHSVLEVNPDGKVVWSLHQDDLPGVRFAWVTTLEVLANGHYVIGNCHAGPDNPLLVEIDPKTKKVVWTFPHYGVFGNSAPNSLLLDQRGRSLR